MGQQQVQQPGQSQKQAEQLGQIPWKRITIIIVIVAFLLAFACLILWNLINVGVLHGAFFDTFSKILVAIGSAATGIGAVLGVYVGIASSLKTFFTPSNEKMESPPVDTPTVAPTSAPPPSPTIIPPSPPQATQSSMAQPSVSEKLISASIIGTFPPTDPKSIQQRHKIVEQVYSELTKPDINCIVLTGIGGIGKSTVAALAYRYAEEQRKDNTGHFTAESLWFTVEATTTFPELAGMLSAALDKPIPDFGKLPPQQQVAALFYALNTTDNPRLVVVNQFENLLNPQIGQATDPTLGNWIDALNSQPCRCRVLLTSRRMPRGTYDYPPTHMQEYPIQRLEMEEGIELLRKQGVQPTQATDAELRTAVTRCDGHALSLELLASILRRNHSLMLKTLSENIIYAQSWQDSIASRLLDYIYEQQLNDVQRQLLRAFSIHREPVPLEAAKVIVDVTLTNTQIRDALDVLLVQHLLQPTGNKCYQLHVIVAEYTQHHFDESSEQANQLALRTAYAEAAHYYVQQAATNCPPRDKRRSADDVKPLIEAVWQYCQAGQWQEAYDLMEREDIFTYLKRWGNYAILLDLYQLLLDKWHPEPLQEARIYNNLGEVYSALEQKQQARDYHEKALDIRVARGDRKGKGETLNNLGVVYRRLGEEDEALKCYEEALSIRKEMGDRKGEGETLSNLGFFYRNSLKYQNHDEALKHYQNSLSIRRKEGDREGEATTLHNMGVVYEHQGKKDEARKHYKEALRIDKAIRNRKGEGLTLWSIGNLYFDEGNYDVALASYLLARDIFGELRILERVVVMQRQLDNICRLRKVDENHFATFLASVEPQTQQVVEQALREGL